MKRRTFVQLSATAVGSLLVPPAVGMLGQGQLVFEQHKVRPDRMTEDYYPLVIGLGAWGAEVARRLPEASIQDDRVSIYSVTQEPGASIQKPVVEPMSAIVDQCVSAVLVLHEDDLWAIDAAKVWGQWVAEQDVALRAAVVGVDHPDILALGAGSELRSLRDSVGSVVMLPKAWDPLLPPDHPYHPVFQTIRMFYMSEQGMICHGVDDLHQTLALGTVCLATTAPEMSLYRGGDPAKTVQQCASQVPLDRVRGIALKWQDGVNQTVADLDALVLSIRDVMGSEIPTDLQMGINPALGDEEPAHLLAVWALVSMGTEPFSGWCRRPIVFD
jgi:hypothetical protein